MFRRPWAVGGNTSAAVGYLPAVRRSLGGGGGLEVEACLGQIFGHAYEGETSAGKMDHANGQRRSYGINLAPPQELAHKTTT